MTPHLKRSGLICAAFLILLVSEARAVSDGFPSGKTLSGDHFSVVLASGIDEGSLVARLGIGPQHRILSGRSVTGLTFSGKLTLASATPRYYQNCNMSEWAYCHFSHYTPDEDFKQLDLAAEKRWDTGTDLRLRLRLDVLNVFNWDNYSGYEDWRGGANEPQNPNFGRPTAVALPTRTFKVSLGFDW